ncbi:MAG TPA: NAD(P)-dependent oxidoreductase [Chthonomonadales bacterium]|nr:NAD(P)-dependent oxidoreductase [Chthonomonadales bacterium]
MRVMVTGGSGNIGRRVVARLAPEHEVLVVDREPYGGECACVSAVCDLTSGAGLDRIEGSFDAIVHLAAIPHPNDDPWERVLSVNLLSTYNVLRYAAERGIARVVFGSSESASGWGIHRTWRRPDYLPIGEGHRSCPGEVYSYSKALGEALCRGFSHEFGMSTVCLRYTFVTFGANYARFLRGLRDNPVREGLGTSYAWIDVEDVASAIDRSLTFAMEPGQSEMFYLTALEHHGTLPTLEMAERNWGPGIAADLEYYRTRPRASLFDIRKAHRLLGWQPEWAIERLVTQRSEGLAK